MTSESDLGVGWESTNDTKVQSGWKYAHKTWTYIMDIEYNLAFICNEQHGL